ncbi:uncharacterized protein LOC135837838 [Planococcus citri]|uniref:uncharacterized protein LOC135837838 n=1 Tax=Planococcus citri TaxID=170843 RepID=UPI0031F830CA
MHFDQFNYVDLIMAMDYLQMEIDRRTYERFIRKNCCADEKIFELYNFVRENPNLQWLFKLVLEYLSVHLADMRNNIDFSSIPFGHIMRIILGKRTFSWEYTPTTSKSKSDVLKVCQVCSEWICTSLENRLAHVAKLVNAVKRRFRYVNYEVNDDDCNTVLSEIAEQIDPKMMTKLFYKFLMYDGGIRVNPAQNLQEDESLMYENSLLEDESLVEDEEREAWIRSEDDGKKFAKLVENNYCYDVVVNVGEKTYKLHRFILNSASGYFAEIFSTKQSNSSDVQCAEVTTQLPNKNETYSIHDVDQTTFDMIIEYIYFDEYFDELQLTLETITRILRAANFLKMEKLFNTCISWIKTHIDEVCAKVLIIDEYMSMSWIKDNIEEIVSRFLTIPDTENTLPICSFTFDMLEYLLMSSTYCCDNPHQIVDACSKWIFHDVKNRYHLIPQIALAINRNLHYNKIEPSTDLINCSSEQTILDELWKTLNHTSLILSVSTEKTPNVGKQKWKEIPVFVAVSERTTTIHVLNADLEEIASLRLSNSDVYQFTATLMDDNLFIMLCLDCDYFRFGVYKLSLKKFISLNNCLELEKPSKCYRSTNTSSLLNCRGQVYCCFKDGYVLKYSIELNRWMKFSEKPVFFDKYLKDKYVWFTSDGDKLYRSYRNWIPVSQNRSALRHVVEEFDFQQNVWLTLSGKSFSGTCSKVKHFTIIQGGELAVIFGSFCMSLNRNLGHWRMFPRPSNSAPDSEKSILLTQCEDRLLHVLDDKLYQWSEKIHKWQFIKELPSKSISSVGVENFRPLYNRISTVHRVNVCTD